MSNIKIDKEQLNSSIKELEAASVQLSNAVQTLRISGELARNGFTVIEEDSIEDYNSNVENITIAYEKMIGYKTQINSVIYHLKGIRTIVEEFELEHANKDIDDLIASVSGSKELLTFLHFEKTDDGKTQLYFDLDGEKRTISEMVNSFYTYTGASMNANIEGRIMSYKVGTSFDEATQKSLLDGVNGFISGTRDNGYFSLLKEDILQNLENEMGTSANTQLSSITIPSEVKTNVGQIVASSVAVGSGLIGAYALSKNISKDKKYKTRDEVTLSIQDMIKDKIQITSRKEN